MQLEFALYVGGRGGHALTYAKPLGHAVTPLRSGWSALAVGRWLVRALDSQAERLAGRYGVAVRVVGLANARDGFIYDGNRGAWTRRRGGYHQAEARAPGRGFGARSGFALTAPATRGTIGLACSRAGRAETLARGGIGRFRRAAR